MRMLYITAGLIALIWHTIVGLIVKIRESKWTIKIGDTTAPQYLKLNEKHTTMIIDRDAVEADIAKYGPTSIPGIVAYKKLRPKAVAFLVMTTIFVFVVVYFILKIIGG